MKLSYLICCKNETRTLNNLLAKVVNVLGDDELVLLDDYSDNEETIRIINKFKPHIKFVQHHLSADYGSHKNFGTEQCSGDFVLQIDGDELPSDYLVGDNLRSIIEANSVEFLYVPRINDFVGVSPEHAKQWGWRLDISPSTNRPRVNFPDYQHRIYKRDISRIKWDRRLHERVIGYDSYAFLPAEEDYALLHDKTIETQIQTNLRYNSMFTQEENKGFTIGK